MTIKERWIALILFFTVFVVYLYTITPTLPFWDCGEFISCSYTLGVPHPPGTPLMILLGNLFIKIFFFIKEVALRVNLFAAISSSMSAVLVYLISMKIFMRVNPNPDKVEKAINIFVSFIAGLTGAFFYSFWQSSVEAEVYTPSTLIILFVMWLALIWWDKLEDANDDRFVILVIYLSILSIGIHMLPLLALPGALTFFIIISWKKHYDLSVSLISFAVFFAFLYLGMTKENLILVFIGAVLSAVSILFIDYQVHDRKVNYKKVYSYLGIYVALLLISISTYAVLLIRAKHNPYINIAAPVTLKELWDVFNRKQYGPMVLLPRKTDTGIGTLPALFEQFKMYARYYSWQFGGYFRGEITNPSHIRVFFSALFISLITATGIYGIWGHFKREKKTFILIFMTFLLLSAGLVVYLNLKYSPSDPNPMHQPREVRERDYFYAPSYFFFMLFFAFGLREMLLSFKKKIINEQERVWKNLSYQQIVIIILILVIGVSPFFANIHSNANRRYNWIADEYAKNLLSTPRENSIIFTNGDNDTYPLWFEQTVKHYRTFEPGESGVMVVNLSLLNVAWYIKQMKSFGVPIQMEDKKIDELIPVRLSNGEILMIRDIVIRDIICTTSGIKANEKLLYAPTDEFIAKVMPNYNADSVNVYFSVTVSESARKFYTNNLILEGLAYRVVSDKEAMQFPDKIDTLITMDNIYHKYQYKSILDPRVYKDDNIDRIMTNYAAGFLQMGVFYARRNELEKAIDLFKEGRKYYSYDRSSVTMNIISIYMQIGKYEEAEKEIKEEMEINKNNLEKKGALQIMLAELYVKQKKYKEALTMFNSIIENYPKEGGGYAGKLKTYYYMGDTINYNKFKQEILFNPEKLGNIIGFLYMQKSDKQVLLDLLNMWLKLRPDDAQALRVKQEVLLWPDSNNIQ